MRGTRGRLAVVAVLAGLGAVVLPAVALGAQPAPAPGALYKGDSGQCSASIHTQCVFKFRVSSSGHALKFVKKGQAISSWQCQGGGGEAVFGSGTNDYQIPTARIRANGSFTGKGGSGTRLIRISGSFTKSAKKATLTFALPHQHCTTPELTLHKR